MMKRGAGKGLRVWKKVIMGQVKVRVRNTVEHVIVAVTAWVNSMSMTQYTSLEFVCVHSKVYLHANICFTHNFELCE